MQSHIPETKEPAKTLPQWKRSVERMAKLCLAAAFAGFMMEFFLNEVPGNEESNYAGLLLFTNTCCCVSVLLIFISGLFRTKLFDMVLASLFLYVRVMQLNRLDFPDQGIAGFLIIWLMLSSLLTAIIALRELKRRFHSPGGLSRLLFASDSPSNSAEGPTCLTWCEDPVCQQHPELCSSPQTASADANLNRVVNRKLNRQSHGAH